jgi:hypothetical protein
VPHLCAVAVGIAATVVLAAPAAAQPSRTVRLHQSDVVAAGFGANDCSDFAPDQPAAGRDGWVFPAPAGQVDDGGRLLALGTPVAVLDVPRIGVHEVVGEGTTAGVLHRARSAPPPGDP